MGRPGNRHHANDAGKLSNFSQGSLNADSFFVKRRTKLGPSEFATEGGFCVTGFSSSLT